MKKFRIMVKGKEYQTRDGQTKNEWNNVGKMTFFPAKDGKEEGYLLELNMFPTTKFSVFEDKPKADEKAQVETTQYEGELHTPIKDEDIPW